MNQIAYLSTEDWWRAMSRDYLRQRAIEKIKLQPFFRPRSGFYLYPQWTPADWDAIRAAAIAGLEINEICGVKQCGCRQCLRDRKDGIEMGGVFWPAESMQMIVCQKCGNKRCPHATDHRNPCTGSNEPGQPGSAYA